MGWCGVVVLNLSLARTILCVIIFCALSGEMRRRHNTSILHSLITAQSTVRSVCVYDQSTTFAVLCGCRSSTYYIDLNRVKETERVRARVIITYSPRADKNHHRRPSSRPPLKVIKQKNANAQYKREPGGGFNTLEFFIYFFYFIISVFYYEFVFLCTHCTHYVEIYFIIL